MDSIFFRRVLAFFIDYIIIIVYAILLFLVSNFLKNTFNIILSFNSPFKNQVLSFFLLTLPVFLYFFLSEKGAYKATFGKRLLALEVVNRENDKGGIFIRNFLKLLPWEIAHTGVYHIIYSNQQQQEISLWVWCALIIPQIIVLFYFTSILATKGTKSIYDNLAKTMVTLRSL